MDEMDWRDAEKAIARLRNANRASLTESDIEYINHYLAVGEHEMALEILGLALMHKPEALLSDMEEIGALAKRLHLDKESVFDADFFKNFNAVLEARRRSPAS